MVREYIWQVAIFWPANKWYILRGDLQLKLPTEIWVWTKCWLLAFQVIISAANIYVLYSINLIKYAYGYWSYSNEMCVLCNYRLIHFLKLNIAVVSYIRVSISLFKKSSPWRHRKKFNNMAGRTQQYLRTEYIQPPANLPTVSATSFFF